MPEGSSGLNFETSASEGAILTIPEGATSINLENDFAFGNYLEANVQKWYEFIYRVRGRNIPNGQIRLVTGCDKTTTWGIATVSDISQQTTSKLKFKALDDASSSTTYSWECSGMAEGRVGPDRQEIEALRNRNEDNHQVDTKLDNQCLFVRTMTATLSDDEWAKLSRNLCETTIKAPNTSFNPSMRSRPSGSDATSSNQIHTLNSWGQGTPRTTTYTVGQESGITISTVPNPSVVSIPPLNTALTRK
jgi:hypothetical protein